MSQKKGRRKPDDDNKTRRSIHDCLGFLAFMPNKPIHDHILFKYLSTSYDLSGNNILSAMIFLPFRLMTIHDEPLSSKDTM